MVDGDQQSVIRGVTVNFLDLTLPIPSNECRQDVVLGMKFFLCSCNTDRCNSSSPMELTIFILFSAFCVLLFEHVAYN